MPRARLVPFVAACLGGLATAPAIAQDDAPIRYGRDVRPILADRCFRCHGPDPATREASLRLDQREAALEARDGGAAIVPGAPERSLLLERVRSHDADELMPPPSSGKPRLREAEIEVLTRWIRDGATYEAHWAFEPPTAPPLPGGEARHPVDRFLDHAQRRSGLPAAPRADRATLVRRTFLVLTGLPPTPEELDAALAEPADGAQERLVDKLLGEEPYRTRHAEHLAQPWLDAARYADTSGIHMDAGRQIWPWRDWLIEALKNDLPFDQFALQQLAGDLLPDATQAQRTASGFLRSHVTTDEGGAIDEEYRVEYAAERTSTFGTVFLGLTLGCARCHDHKYDPITQVDYYRLFAHFNNNQEPGLYSQSPDPNRALEPFLTVPTAAQAAELARLRAERAAAEAALHAEGPDEADHRTAFAASLAAAGLAWLPTTVTAAHSTGGSTLAVQPDGSVLASGENPNQDRHVLELRVAGGDLRLLALEALGDPSLPGGKVGRAPNGNAVLESVQVEARPLGSSAAFAPVPLVWAAADTEQRDGDYAAINALHDDGRGWAVAAHQHEAGPRRLLLVAGAPFGAAAGTELRVTLDYDTAYAQHTLGRVRVHAGQAGEALLQRLPVATGGFYLAGPFPSGREPYAEVHGPEQASTIDLATRWGKHGWRFDAAVREGRVQKLPAGIHATYLAQRQFAVLPRQQELQLGSDDGFQLFVNGQAVAERRVDRAVGADQDRATAPVPAGESLLVLKVVNTGGQGGSYLRRVPTEPELLGDLLFWLWPAAGRDPALQRRLDLAWRERFSPDFAARRAKATELAAAVEALDKALPRTMVMQEATAKRATYVLMRGEYDKPDKNRQVQPGLPAVFGSLPADGPQNRLGLARWLVAAENPLFRRVAVNRLFEFVFGDGLVRTTDDFGLQGEWPSHPELLDWLAVEFQRQGHSVRAMLRLLCTSEAFLRAARPVADARDRDPAARQLAWFPRRRLSGEVLRDQALYVAGLLVEQQGGPSVKPYQPPGLWQEVAMIQSNTRAYEPGTGAANWRRSLYTYWKRACPPPSLLTFDAPTREFCVVRRSRTNTPLQALVLWNDPQFVEASRRLAERTLQAAGDDRARLAALFRRCTGAPPDAATLADAEALLGQLRSRYAAAPADAQALLAVGEAKPDPTLPAAELAAWTLVANACLSLDATVCLD